METRHITPGPWEIDSELPPNGRSVIARTTGGITISASVIGPHNPDDDEANAHLIIAAPNLLLACKAALIDFSDDELYATHRETINTLKTAIALVEGRSD